MTIRRVVFVNGFPRAGKDTVVAKAREQLAARGVPSIEVTAIQPTLDMLESAGFPVDHKTARLRTLLAEVRAATEKYNNTGTDYCIHHTQRLANENDGSVIAFVHCREPENIAKIEAGVSIFGFRPCKVLVDGVRAEKDQTNASDLGVLDGIAYDLKINNNGTLDDLDLGVADMVGYLLRPQTQPASRHPGVTGHSPAGRT